jgi:hypothetical protein
MCTENKIIPIKEETLIYDSLIIDNSRKNYDEEGKAAENLRQIKTPVSAVSNNADKNLLEQSKFFLNLL